MEELEIKLVDLTASLAKRTPLFKVYIFAAYHKVPRVLEWM